jgi:tripartite-type tricarboxylate transporter receptor subunit TctC
MQRRQLIAAAALLGAGGATLAQGTYPDQIIKWVVPYPAGGGTDNLARTLADTMHVALGQTIVVDNRPGAATNIGADSVAKARPDGYTIMSADNAMMAFNEHLFKKLPYSPEKDFTYIGSIGRFPLVLAVHPDFPTKDFKSFLAYVRANPGKVSYASVGNGSPHHLAMEMFKYRTKTDIMHIPYKGAAPAMQDVMAGQVPVMFLDLASGLSIVQSGKVRVLAIGTSKRSPLLPDVPTLAELGVQDTEVFAFQGLVGPTGLPPAVTTRLNQELNKALANPAVLKRFTDFGMEPMPGTPEQFRALARQESQRWGPVIKASGIALD